MISGEWASIIPWSTENPNLYVAKLELKNPEGKIVQTRETQHWFPYRRVLFPRTAYI